jgi:hypothetical protein
MNLTPVDVLVVSAGPTGLTLAAQLAWFGTASPRDAGRSRVLPVSATAED